MDSRIMKKEESVKQLIEAFNNSPYYRLLGIKAGGLKKGKCETRMIFKKELTYLNGFVNEGAIASLADSSVTMAMLGWIDPGERIMTIELKINYLLSVNQGELTADARIIHKNSRTAYGVAEVTNEEGELVARLVKTFGIERVD